MRLTDTPATFAFLTFLDAQLDKYPPVVDDEHDKTDDSEGCTG